MIKMRNFSGRKVKINVEKIKKRQKKMLPNYQEFIENNIDKVFTAQATKNTQEPELYTLIEDKSKPKWVFWAEDLIVLKDK